MPDVLAVLSRWWKRIATLTLFATAIAVVAAVLLPSTYVSVATALPASSFATDKSAIFNANIQQLYSSLGTADDLDRMIGTARLDTIYIAAVAELDLATHYGISGEPDADYRAAQKLKKQSSISKSEWGELKIKVRDAEPNAAAKIANVLLEKLQGLHQSLQSQSNQLVLQKLKETYGQLQARDTGMMVERPAAASKTRQLEQLPVYEKLVSEYNLMVAANPPALLVVEAARPALQPDNTTKLSYTLLTFFTALVFSILLALYTERKKDS